MNISIRRNELMAPSLPKMSKSLMETHATFYKPTDKKNSAFQRSFFYFANFYAALEAFLAAKAFIVSMM